MSRKREKNNVGDMAEALALNDGPTFNDAMLFLSHTQTSSWI